jgi:asparagine synthase (glutamine-hydrolysing)
MQHTEYRKYFCSSEGIVTGSAFCHEKKYSEDDLLDLISEWDEEKHFYDGLTQINGFYALIKKKDHQLIAAVDRLRSIPLFYAKVGTNFFLSDCADWIRQQVGNNEMDALAREEFLLTGYVTGSDTLYHDVKQLQAGEMLIVQDGGNNLEVKRRRYYRFFHDYRNAKSLEQVMEEHDQVLIKLFQRLIKIANGRTIVVPLSGGYDSRLIVLMLKRLRYDNLIAFSYGRLGNKESAVSKQIADALGIKWLFIEYSNELWFQWYRSEEYRQYSMFAAGCSSLPHIQDWPAVLSLKKQNLIPTDSIIVPGHSADLPAGSRSQNQTVSSLYSEELLDPLKPIQIILNYHYSLIDWYEKRQLMGPIFIHKIIEMLNPIQQFPDGASVFESWDTAERQAKFIVNSIRVYEFWGYTCWIPFWDYEYMQYWCGVELKFRKNQFMYKRFVNDLFFAVTGRHMNTEKKQTSYTQWIKKSIASFLCHSIKKKIKKYLRMDKVFIEKEYYSHPLAFWGIHQLPELQKYEHHPVNINSVLVQDFIGDSKTC